MAILRRAIDPSGTHLTGLLQGGLGMASVYWTSPSERRRAVRLFRADRFHLVSKSDRYEETRFPFPYEEVPLAGIF